MLNAWEDKCIYPDWIYSGYPYSKTSITPYWEISLLALPEGIRDYIIWNVFSDNQLLMCSSVCVCVCDEYYSRTNLKPHRKVVHVNSL